MGEQNIKSYSSTSYGNKSNIARLHMLASSKISQHVLNSYNVIGSNWSLKRVLSFNVSAVYNTNFISSHERLVKGRLLKEEEDGYRGTSVKKITSLFHMVYEDLQVSRKNWDRLQKMLK